MARVSSPADAGSAEIVRRRAAMEPMTMPASAIGSPASNASPQPTCGYAAITAATEAVDGPRIMERARPRMAACAAVASSSVRPRSDPPNMLTAPKERPRPAIVTPSRIAQPRSGLGARAAIAATAWSSPSSMRAGRISATQRMRTITTAIPDAATRMRIRSPPTASVPRIAPTARRIATLPLRRPTQCFRVGTRPRAKAVASTP